MTPEIVVKALEKYGLEYTLVLSPHKGYRNESFPVLLRDGRKINLLFYKTEPEILRRIKRTNMVSNYLYDKGFPTRKLLDTRLLCLASGHARKYAAIHTYLPGNPIPWESYTKNHLKLLGMVMSNMHAQLSKLPSEYNKLLKSESDIAQECHHIAERMQVYFRSSTVQLALKHKLGLEINIFRLAQLHKYIAVVRQLPRQQALHMDFVRGNILFETSNTAQAKQLFVGKVRLSGILDFEKTGYGHPAFDIARTLAFLLVDCKYKSEQDIRKYFLHSGYNKRGNSSFYSPVIIKNGVRINLFEELVTLFLIYDFYKFFKHNPYEFLSQNEHFLRTKDILEKRKMIEYI